LRKNVDKKNGESLVHLSPVHATRNRQLQRRVDVPQYVRDELCFVIHLAGVQAGANGPDKGYTTPYAVP
jgi:hypothetical protein